MAAYALNPSAGVETGGCPELTGQLVQMKQQAADSVRGLVSKKKKYSVIEEDIQHFPQGSAGSHTNTCTDTCAHTLPHTK